MIVTTHAGKKWATTFLLHGSMRSWEMDQNNDSFLDFPLGTQANIVNRWVYNSGTGLLFQASLKYLKDYKQGGQSGFDPDVDKFTSNRYGFEIDTERKELVAKLGYVFPSKPYQSVGLQVSWTDHNHSSYYGYNVHNARQKSFYANAIFQSIINSTQHKFKTGLSVMVDNMDETFHQRGFIIPKPVYDFGRQEIVPGAFVEYEYNDAKIFSFTAGIRADYHNLFGLLYVPRLHAKVNASPTTTFRINVGKGIRLANILAENTGFLASSREFLLDKTQTTSAYGFRPDEAWNYGFSFSQDFNLNYRPGVLSLDYYYTDFINQVIADYDHDPQQVTFFGLEGKSFSHSLQAQLDYEPIRRLDVRVAFRWLNVSSDYLDGKLSRPLIPTYRAFINVAYETKSKWKFDLTVQRIGKQRLPSTLANPSEYRVEQNSEDYWNINSQITKDFGKRWSVYLGGENLTGFRLKNPIVSSSDPFSPYFDSSMVWGPVFGRMVYAGFRFRMN